ncbi:MAG TPA: PAS domain S-box protein [Puia sp.]|nr:PAS domain S-box protein [Puia sp.]
MIEHRQVEGSAVPGNATTTSAQLSPDCILDHMPAAVYACSKDGAITYFNETAVRLWGYRPEIGGRLESHAGTFSIFINGQYVRPDETPMGITLSTGQAFSNIPALVRRPDGSSFHASVSINPVYDAANELAGAIGVFHDVSESKRAEADTIQQEIGPLLESEKRYRLLAGSLEKMVQEKARSLQTTADQLTKSEERYHRMIEQIEDYAIILLDSEGVVQNWNKGAEKIKGYKEDEIVGKSFQEFYLQDDLENGLPSRLLNEAKTKGKALYEGWRKRKDGSIFWGSVVLTALHDDHGGIVGFSKVTRDLTEKKQSEDRKKVYLEQLEFQNKELEQFVYAASHDMKEPLRKIHIYNTYISDNPVNQIDARSREYLTRSVQAVQRMNGLIEDLLAYSRITHIEDGFELVDLNEIVDEIAAFHKEDFENNAITMQRDPLPVLKAIPFQIKQLLSNLIDNAVKYKHPDRPARIAIGYEKISGKLFSAGANPYRHYHRLSVKDNGIGFEPVYAEKLFQIFQRLPNSSTVKGSGIGLAICKKILQTHKGWIEATGIPGSGATFIFYLPAED